MIAIITNWNIIEYNYNENNNNNLTLKCGNNKGCIVFIKEVLINNNNSNICNDNTRSVNVSYYDKLTNLCMEMIAKNLINL